MSAATPAPAVEVTARKRIGDCVALAGAHLRVEVGTIHALCGENGAGKSTLMRVVYGLTRADAGQLELGGPIDLAHHGVAAARARGVGMVHQHGMLVPTLTLAENAALGREPMRAGLLDLARARRELAEAAARLGEALDPDVRAGALTVGEQQRAEVVMVVARAERLLILDEPTALLTPGEVERLFALLRRVAAGGGAVVLVTHKLDEVTAIADAITVLRAGVTVAELPGSTEPRAIARAMVGGEPPGRAAPPPAPAAGAAVVLAARGTDGIDLAIRAGEVVGVAGIEGNGQRELVLALTGLTRPRRGRVELGGADVTAASVAARRAAGLAHVPEDRHRHGLVLDATLAENLTLGRTAEVTGARGWLIDRGRRRALAERTLIEHDVRPADPDLPARALSGGNQQKLVVARELGRAGVRAVIAAQPTRGVDLAAVAGIHDRLRAIATAGAGVLLVSADLDELFALSHRIVVLHRGRIAGELDQAQLVAPDARARLGAWMVGAT